MNAVKIQLTNRIIKPQEKEFEGVREETSIQELLDQNQGHH